MAGLVRFVVLGAEPLATHRLHAVEVGRGENLARGDDGVETGNRHVLILRRERSENRSRNGAGDPEARRTDACTEEPESETVRLVWRHRLRLEPDLRQHEDQNFENLTVIQRNRTHAEIR